MLHRLNKEACDHCGRITEEENIDEHGICNHCHESSREGYFGQDEGYEGDEYDA